MRLFVLELGGSTSQIKDNISSSRVQVKLNLQCGVIVDMLADLHYPASQAIIAF